MFLGKSLLWLVCQLSELPLYFLFLLFRPVYTHLGSHISQQQQWPFHLVQTVSCGSEVRAEWKCWECWEVSVLRAYLHKCMYCFVYCFLCLPNVSPYFTSLFLFLNAIHPFLEKLLVAEIHEAEILEDLSFHYDAATVVSSSCWIFSSEYSGSYLGLPPPTLFSSKFVSCVFTLIILIRVWPRHCNSGDVLFFLLSHLWLPQTNISWQLQSRF